MVNPHIDKIIEILEIESKHWKVPIVTLIAVQNKEPFKVLISTILSLRTKDQTTADASFRLFGVLNSPNDIHKLSVSQIQKLIYPVGFYKTKAKTIIEICTRLITEFNSEVPSDLDTLLTFKGIGRKTANLVLSEGFGIPAMCVDTHVHRISNRFGYVKTKTPYDTEMKLREILPQKYWIRYNSLLVAFGQHLCKPVSPICSKCPVENYCPKIGVEKFR